MVLDTADKDYITKAMGGLTKEINTNFGDISKKLESIEGRLDTMDEYTRLIPDIFKLLEDDGRDVVKLTAHE